MNKQQVEFDFEKGRTEAKRGMDLSRKARKELLELAQGLARTIARRRPERTCTADDVQRELIALGHQPWALGNAAGSLFRGEEWFCVDVVPSARVSRHSNKIGLWKLAKGE